MRYVFLGIVITLLIAFVMNKKTNLDFGESLMIIYMFSAFLSFIGIVTYLFAKFW